MKAKVLVVFLAAGVLLSAGTLAAHHAVQAQFAVNEPAVQLVGTLGKMEWINPHAKIHVIVKKADGTVEDWELQLAGANQLRRVGFPLSARGGAKVGESVTATAFRARNGSTTGILRSIKFADGREYMRGVYGEADLAR
jgi:hypothetical protein